MKILPILLLFLSASMLAQNKYSLNGTVKDQSSGETLFGATVFLQNSTIGTTTNEYGFYSLSLEEGKYTLVISYLGFDDVLKEIEIYQDQNLNIELSESTDQLQEIILETNNFEDINLRKPQMSVSKLNVSTIKQMPAVLERLTLLNRYSYFQE